MTALLPAAGRGTRLGRLLTSKELVTVGISEKWPGGRPVIDHLLERIAFAGIRTAHIVTLADKRDIAATLGDSQHGLQLEVIETPPTPSSVHTLCATLSRSDQPYWALGYPDILFEPKNAYRQLLDSFTHDCDLLLGLFPSDRAEKSDMVELDQHGRLLNLRIKQPDSGLRFTWSIACWGPRFSGLLLEAAATRGSATDGRASNRELFVGDVIQTALERDYAIGTLAFPEGWALDIGTADDLVRARSLDLAPSTSG